MTRDTTATPPDRSAATLPMEGRETRRNRSAQIAIAKALRRRMTGPEAKLWVHLKRIKTIDTHFRKQVPIGDYVVDFACLRGRLVIEVDGEQHGRFARSQADIRRDEDLRSQGFTVLRFWNDDVLRSIDAVLDTIHASLHGSPSAVPRSMSKRRDGQGRPPSSPSMGEVVRLAGPEGEMTVEPRLEGR